MEGLRQKFSKYSLVQLLIMIIAAVVGVGTRGLMLTIVTNLCLKFLFSAYMVIPFLLMRSSLNSCAKWQPDKGAGGPAPPVMNFYGHKFK